MCDVRDQILDGFLEENHDSVLVCSGIRRTMDGWMSLEQGLTNADKTTYNYLEETYCTTRLLRFFINEIHQEKFDDGKVNNAYFVLHLTRWN